MPPKKKKGKKSGKKRGERKSAKGGDAAETLTELSKEFYLIQIRDLETRLTRYQRKCDELEITSDKFKSGFDQQATDKKEIVSFLKKQLEQRSDEIADLQERIIGLQQAKDSEKDQFDVQLSSLRTEMQEVKDQLTSENMVLGGKLASLEEFRVQREGLMQKFARMEDTLRNQEQDHKDVIYKLEKKSVIDKDRLKKEMVIRVNNVASEFRKVSNKQIADTTKRTLRENVAINSQLAKMSDKTMELIKESDGLKGAEKDTKLKMELLEHNEKEIMKKNTSNIKLIRMLTEKAKQQQEVIKSFELQKDDVLRLKQEVTELEHVRAEGEYRTRAMENNLRDLREQLAALSESSNALESKNSRLLTALSGSVETLKSSLKAVDSKDEDAKNHARMSLLQTLIGIMDVAANENVAFTTADLTSHDRVHTKPSIWHYQMGDLGVIPSQPRVGISRRKNGSQRQRTLESDSDRKTTVKLPLIPS